MFVLNVASYDNYDANYFLFNFLIFAFSYDNLIAVRCIFWEYGNKTMSTEKNWSRVLRSWKWEVEKFKTVNSQLPFLQSPYKGGFRVGPREHCPPSFVRNSFSFVNVCRMVLRALLLKYTCISLINIVSNWKNLCSKPSTFSVANDQSYQNACS